MTKLQQDRPGTPIFATALLAMVCWNAGQAGAADLSTGPAPRPVYTARPLYAVIPSPPPAPQVYTYAPFGLDPGPASSHGYYGYYGFDVAGTPYYGLYSANVACLRSVATRWGYRTVNVCHPD